jgi:TonB-linked SusC/RagA family outer membrane protein
MKIRLKSLFKIARIVTLTSLAFTVLLSTALAQQTQQQNTVKGSVKEENGEPMAGVNVLEKSSGRGVVTDANGNFSINVSKAETTLSFSFIGFLPQQVTVKAAQVVNIVLKEDITQLEEVAVIAYGTQKKETITGAVSTIQAVEIQKTTTASFGNALQGRITGLISTQNAGGMPGLDDAQLLLRGAATINGAQPLILIDGIPRETIRTVDVTEVESVSVLKDASATAVFGVEGANGVIIITTKRGMPGKAELSFTANQTFSTFTRRPERLSSVEYIDLRNESYLNRGLEPAYSWKVRDRFANPLGGLDPSDPDYARQKAIREYMYPSHDYYGEVFKKWAPETRINTNVRGGTDKVSYYVNVGYIFQGGHLNTEPKSKLGYDPSINLDRWSFRTNMDYNVNKVMKAHLNIATYIEKQNAPTLGSYGSVPTLMQGLMQETTRMNPLHPGPYTSLDVDPDVVANMVINTPVGDLSPFTVINRRGYTIETRINLNSTFALDFDFDFITQGLTGKASVSYDVNPASRMNATKSEKTYNAMADYDNDNIVFYENDDAEQTLSLSRGASSEYRIYSTFQLDYSRRFGVHNVAGLLLAKRDSWETGDLPYNKLGLVGRLVYNYLDRYFGEINMGYNGSEQFAPKSRFGFFPALSVGWALSNEDFMSDIKHVDFLKIRGSYGKVGNDDMGSSRFLYLDNITMGGGNGVAGLGLNQTVNISLIGNPGIQWEEAVKTNIGIDFTLFKNLKGAIDYFHEKRSSVLISRGLVPAFQGISQGAIAKTNLGKIQNQGVELELSYNHRFNKNLSVYAKGNIGSNHNKYLYADEAMGDDTYAYKYRLTGYSLGQQWGYLVDWNSPGHGYWTSQEEINNSGLIYDIGTPQAGYLKYLDLNGDGHISDKDHAPMGNSNIPGLTYGLDLGVNYHGLDLSVFFSGIGDYSSIWTGEAVYEFAVATGTYFNYHKNAWTEERFMNGDKITYPALSPESTSNHTSNEFFLQDRSFLRLRDVELGWSLPSKWINPLLIKSVRIFAKGQNLYIWDHLNVNHLDPEKSDPKQYPITKLFGFGANITF